MLDLKSFLAILVIAASQPALSEPPGEARDANRDSAVEHKGVAQASEEDLRRREFNIQRAEEIAQLIDQELKEADARSRWLSRGSGHVSLGIKDQERADGIRHHLGTIMAEADGITQQMRASSDRFRFEPDMSTVSLAAFQDVSPTPLTEAGADGFVSQDQSGNDPRDFTTKFMPYFRHMELGNDVEIDELVAFAFIAFNPRFGMTFEWPLLSSIDPSSALPPGFGTGRATGMGDTILRFFYRPEALEWSFMGEKNFSIMPLVEFTLPTATDDIIGGDVFIISPGFVAVFDAPVKEPPFGLGFFAMMNFLDLSAYRGETPAGAPPPSRLQAGQSVTRFRGRWFWMQPISKPTPEFSILDLSGLYFMLEMQPIYDFIESDFDLWIGTEFGKIIKPGLVFYAKPGWGIDPDPEDREFTFECGMRYFF